MLKRKHVRNGRIQFNYPAVTIKDGTKVFRIDKIVTERKTDSQWLIDDENFLYQSNSKSLDIVLVLDVSSSLGENVATIKQNSEQMISDILSQNPDARISVVKFSRGSVSYDFSSSKELLVQFVYQNTTFNSPDIGPYELEGRSETALYESINEAIELLKSSNAKGKGIFIFTDGVSNFQFAPKFQFASGVVTSLKSVDISCYTIGFEGNQGKVDQNALKEISINGEYSFPKNLAELSKVFQRFSNSVAAVYDLIYDTNKCKVRG